MADSAMTENRSKLKEFLASIATIRGDLSNITAPPFVLDTKSVVELPAFWAERPAVFVAPTASANPAERALLVLKWFISCLKNQQYAGRSPAEGVKKPLNAFLGEVFIAQREDDAGTTMLVSEQVSHHPPVTACRVWNDDHGVSAEGYTRQEITFNGSVNIRQIGHAVLRLARHDESYLIPLPNVKVKGILTGSPYPELQGKYHIPSTSGYDSTIEFGGQGLFSGSDKRHRFNAQVYHEDEIEATLYTLSGNWDSEFMVRDVKSDAILESFDARTAKTTPLIVEDLSKQDPWETRVAWRGVREALVRGDMQAAAHAKSKIENGQRGMRDSHEDGKSWERRFFVDGPLETVVTDLARKIGKRIDPKDTVGAWQFRLSDWNEGNIKKPYRGDLRPDNTRVAQANGDQEGHDRQRDEDPHTSAGVSHSAAHPSTRPPVLPLESAEVKGSWGIRSTYSSGS